MGALNHAVPFVIAMTLVITALQFVFSMLARMAGLDAVSSFFRPTSA